MKEVRDGEVLALRPLPEEDPKGALVSVDLTLLLQDGLLQEVVLTPVEESTFVAYAAAIDDGEARSSAVAMHRGLTLVTDDRASIRFVQSLSPTLPVLTTMDWIKSWADTTAVETATLGEVLRRIELCARYRPPRHHPLKSWWEEHLP